MARIIAAFTIVIFLCTVLTGCYDRREIDSLGYVIAIGFDKGKTNFYKMTLQFAVPESTGGGKGSSGAGGGAALPKSSSITTVETPTLFSGLNMVNNYISKQANLSHAKILVISKEFASEGIGKLIHAIIRSREFRPNMYMVVSRDSAEEYIKNVKPTLQTNPAKYYELNFSSYIYTGFTANTQLQRFYIEQESDCTQAVAILAGVNKYESSDDFDIKKSTFKEKDRPYPFEGDFKAGDIPRTFETKSEIMGLAVFNRDRMVGELDGEEAMYYLMATGEHNYSYMTFPDPKQKGMFVVLNVKQSRKPLCKVDISGKRPNIRVNIKMEADYLAIQSGINYESMENNGIMEKAAEDFLKKGITSFLYKTSKEFKSDICGFGKHVKNKFLFWDDWIKYDWLKKYKDSVFDVEVDLKIRRPGLIIRSLMPGGYEGT